MLPAPMCEIPVLLAKAIPTHISLVPNWSSQTDPSSFDLLAFHSPCSRLSFSPTVPPKLSLPMSPVTSTSSEIAVSSQGCTFVADSLFLAWLPRGSSQCWNQTVTRSATHPSPPHHQPMVSCLIWGETQSSSFGPGGCGQSILDLPTTCNARGALCVPCGPPFCFSNSHIYHNQAFVLPSSSSLPQVCETLPHQPELPQPFRLKCPTLSFSHAPTLVSQ